MWEVLKKSLTEMLAQHLDLVRHVNDDQINVRSSRMRQKVALGGAVHVSLVVGIVFGTFDAINRRF